MKTVIKAIDLFCGVGGITHGFIKSGIDVIAGVDIDKSCKFAYEYNNINSDGNKSIFIQSSVADIDSEFLGNLISDSDFTVLAGCAPCQPFSRHQKNKKDRDKHEKWGLLNDFMVHIKNIYPDIISMENVPEIVTESIFRDFINLLGELKYNISYKIINSADYGVPQRRRRLILLASKLGEIKLINPTHKNSHVTVKDVIYNLPKIKAGERDKIDRLHHSARLSPLNLKRIKASIPGGTWHDWDSELLPNCYLKSSGKSYTSVYGRMEWDKVAPTLTTQFTMYGTGRFGHPDQDRAISLREGAIIQTFPINYKFNEDENYSKTVISRHIGNAVPVRLGEIIGISIVDHINSRRDINGSV